MAEITGVSRAHAVDLDADGELDVIASALLATGADIDQSELPALVRLEQVKPEVFERHTLEKSGQRYASIDLGAFDQDGDIDILVGTLTAVSGSRPSTSWLELWENTRIGRRVP